MKITVCELRDDPNGLAEDWNALIEHVREETSDLVLLPEMPFSTWLARSDKASHAAWMKAVELHQQWIERLTELASYVVCGSRPIVVNGKRHNEAFTWEPESGYRGVHTKYYLPNEPGFWEAVWYDRGEPVFNATQTRIAKVGFLVCSEVWFTEHARFYARQGAQLLLVPRSTERATTDKWIAGGRAAAVMSGAFCLSSNRSGQDAHGMAWGGSGWIIEPDQGKVLGLTSEKQPFLTLEINLQDADRAKLTYPRYISE
ncbi:MAG: carbon-nitrogen hydrolase family protein [Anaerolineae bacterium]|nr:carbon-nitrogen hydrolase family protein [Anaerolineae bacterium]